MVRGLRIDAKDDARNTRVGLGNLATLFLRPGKLGNAARLRELALAVAEADGDTEGVFVVRLDQYATARDMGAHDRADALWDALDPMGRNWSRDLYRGGDAERIRAEDLFQRGTLTEKTLAKAEALCRENRSRESLCDCRSLRGRWHLSRGEPDMAIDPLNEVLRLYREAGRENAHNEALLALAQLRAGRPVEARAVAERLDRESGYNTALAVAELWRELGETARAAAAARRAHKSACGSGEPYVFRYHLDRAEALLQDLGETPPVVPQHDPAKDEVFDFEPAVRALIEKTRKEREEREAAEKAED